MPGYGVRQHVADLRPDTVDLFKAGAEFVPDQVDHPHDQGQRQQRDQRQPRVDGEQDHRRHHDHQHIGGEIQQMQRQEQADAVGFRTDARHQVAGAFAAEILQRQMQQVIVGDGAQIGADALADQRQNVGLGPTQSPGQQCRAEQSAEQQGHHAGIDGCAVLIGDQHLVHQRHGQIGRHQGGGRRSQHQQKTAQQLPLVRLGETPQAQQHPTRGRHCRFNVAEHTLFLVGCQRYQALGANRRWCVSAGLPAKQTAEHPVQTGGRSAWHRHPYAMV